MILPYSSLRAYKPSFHPFVHIRTTLERRDDRPFLQEVSYSRAPLTSTNAILTLFFALIRNLAIASAPRRYVRPGAFNAAAPAACLPSISVIQNPLSSLPFLNPLPMVLGLQQPNLYPHPSSQCQPKTGSPWFICRGPSTEHHIPYLTTSKQDHSAAHRHPTSILLSKYRA